MSKTLALFNLVFLTNFVFLVTSFIFHAPLSAAESSKWGYEGKTGPDNWSKINPNYAMCGLGKNQSPINIRNTVEAQLEKINFFYKESKIRVTNNGHTLQANLDGNYVTINNKRYDLVQIHFHTPSEHHVNDKAYPLEAHLVHKNKKGNRVVISILFEAKGNQADPFIQALIKYGSKQINTTWTLPKQHNPKPLLPKIVKYYYYNGSVTIPPCTEGIKWYVLKTPRHTSQEQIDKLTEIMGTNNRPVQKLNARIILAK